MVAAVEHFQFKPPFGWDFGVALDYYLYLSKFPWEFLINSLSYSVSYTHLTLPTTERV